MSGKVGRLGLGRESTFHHTPIKIRRKVMFP